MGKAIFFISLGASNLVLELIFLLILLCAFKCPVLALVFPSLESPLSGIAQLKTSYIFSHIWHVHFSSKTNLLVLLHFFPFFFFILSQKKNHFYCMLRCAEDKHCVCLQYTQTTTIPPTAVGTPLHYVQASPRAQRAGRVLPGPTLLLWRQKMTFGH